MKKPTLVLILLAITVIAKAQLTPVKVDSPKLHHVPDDVNIDAPSTFSNAKVDPHQIYSAVEVQAQFPGGYQAFIDFIKRNQQSPKDANLSLGKVIVQFVVELDGSLTNFRILRSPTDINSAEALRVLKKSPKWKPAMQNNQAVRSYYTIPISLGDQKNMNE